MRHCILILLLISMSRASLGQNKDAWLSFWNKDSTLIGYKDLAGNIKIEPKFIGMTKAKIFDDIIAATEDVKTNWKSYYLTKTGRMVGSDSMHMIDNETDCESEGFIRFRDYKSDKAGMLNKNGDIAIPAEYNELSRVTNGMIYALKDAEKKYEEGGEHYSWEGGKELLIDSNNNVLIENFKWVGYLDYFSVRISATPSSDTLRHNFKAVDGQYYSFVDFDKEFKTWLKSNLLNDFTKEHLLDATYSEVYFWKERKGWIHEPKKSFIEKNFELIKSKLLELNKDSCDYSILNYGLNLYTDASDEFKSYFDNCGDPKIWIYPLQTIAITHKVRKDFVQDEFEFLKTKEGYKLMCITIRKGRIQ